MRCHTWLACGMARAGGVPIQGGPGALLARELRADNPTRMHACVMAGACCWLAG